MNRKITALALGLLLAVVPGVAFAQLNAGGTQTYTFPRLTVAPGPFTLSGTFSLTGDLTFGGDLVFSGTAFDTTLSFTDPSADRAIVFPDLAGTVLLGGAANTHTGTTSIDADTALNLTSDGNVTVNADVDADNSGTLNLIGAALDSTFTEGAFVSNIDFTPSAAGGISMTDGTNTGLYQLSPLTHLLRATGAVDQGQIYMSAPNNIQINADTDGDADGTILLSTDNAGQTVTLDSDSIDLVSNATVNVDVGTSFEVDTVAGALTSDINGYPGYIEFDAGNGTASVGVDIDGDLPIIQLTLSDGTDSVNILEDPSGIALNADSDGDGDGTLSLSSENGTQAITLGSNAVLVQSDAEVSEEANDGAGNVSQLDLITTQAALTSTDGTAALGLTLDNSGVAMTLSTSDGTDTADVRGDATSVTIDADVDDDADGTVTLTTANSTTQVVLTSTGTDITNYLFPEQLVQASLGAPANGAIVFCTDCDPASTPCTAAGAQTGAFAFRVNGQWDCPW